MLNAHNLVLLSSNVKLKLAKLLISRLLQGSELKYEFFIALRLVAEVSLKLEDATLLLVLSFREVLNLAFEEVCQVLFHMGQLFGLAVFELLHFFGVLEFKLRFNIVVCGEDTIHVLFSLLLSLKEAQLGPVKLILETRNFVLQVSVLTGEEILVLIKKVNLASKALVVPLNIGL